MESLIGNYNYQPLSIASARFKVPIRLSSQIPTGYNIQMYNGITDGDDGYCRHPPNIYLDIVFV